MHKRDPDSGQALSPLHLGARNEYLGAGFAGVHWAVPPGIPARRDQSVPRPYDSEESAPGTTEITRPRRPRVNSTVPAARA